MSLWCLAYSVDLFLVMFSLIFQCLSLVDFSRVSSDIIRLKA